MERETHIDQQKRIENPEGDPHKYSQLIFDKEAKAVQWKRDILFSEWFWSNWTSIRKKIVLTYTSHLI